MHHAGSATVWDGWMTMCNLGHWVVRNEHLAVKITVTEPSGVDTSDKTVDNAIDAFVQFQKYVPVQRQWNQELYCHSCGRPLTYMRHGRVFDTVASALVLLGASVCILENCEPGIDRRTLCRGGLCWTCEGIKL
eukprot:1159942-Pelagomonas_calceolata.AAC.16